MEIDVVHMMIEYTKAVLPFSITEEGDVDTDLATQLAAKLMRDTITEITTFMEDNHEA